MIVLKCIYKIKINVDGWKLFIVGELNIKSLNIIHDENYLKIVVENLNGSEDYYLYNHHNVNSVIVYKDLIC